MPNPKLIIGTRGSALALTQTNTIADALRRVHLGLEVEIRTINTRGDATQAANVPLASFGEKGIFAKELETALLDGEIDLAVHSMKDLAHTMPPGLVLAAVPKREDPRDALIGSTLDSLRQGALVGTGSVRRRALFSSRRPDLRFLEIRGNIDTRLKKLEDGGYDAICLAAAGLKRLGLADRVTEYLDPEWFVPDPGQGALALQTRESDVQVRGLLSAVNDMASFVTTRAERGFLRAVGGSCQTPVGAHARHIDGGLMLRAMLVGDDGLMRRAEAGGAPGMAEELGARVAKMLR
ncbi:porphobilinogen deaminase [Capsulimonas corticalis]|uniref:Porphobilinogen deaminase n=1 Tax=Capsulimonas corticalis TaxID=2219043 RepID=A0A402CTZ4_9BACT|nr:hydroxymethylbilane synthase [Capsulimonas corticalis]BDI28824.1 porphobilinogen deaminase [Capsulimonas corticalis]